MRNFSQRRSVLRERLAGTGRFRAPQRCLFNAAYGCLSNVHYRWFDTRLAESITSTGQLTVKWAERAINRHLNETLGTDGVDYVIAVDTDSTYVNFGPLVDRVFKTDEPDVDAVIKFLDRVCEEKIKGVLQSAFVELFSLLNVIEPRITMKREIIADRGVWTAAKNYILNVYDKEGVRNAEPKIEVKGIKAAKPSTPSMCRKKIVDAFKLLMTGDRDKLMELVIEFRDHFYQLGFEDIAFTRSIKFQRDDGTVWSTETKGLPIQIRGALLYNELLDKHEVKTAQPIRDGEKARFCYLKPANPMNCHVIAAPHGLPKQFGADDYLDKKTQFEKTFQNPIFEIMEAIGWHTEQPSALGELFG